MDHRSDIWSLGMVLYEMLAAHPSFEGDNLLTMRARFWTRRAARSRVGLTRPGMVSRALKKGREHGY